MKLRPKSDYEAALVATERQLILAAAVGGDPAMMPHLTVVVETLKTVIRLYPMLPKNIP